MRFLVQRVKSSILKVNNETISEISFGYNIFVGVTKEDTLDNIKRTAKRIATLRLFENEDGKLSYNINEVNGEILLVSNFTLCDKKGVSGARPDFSPSADKTKALEYYNLLYKELTETYNIKTKLGKFGEDMQIYTQLDGPINVYQEY